MGQASSQLESTQVLEKTATFPGSSSLNMAAPPTNKKHARAVSANEDVLPRIVKKLKTHDQHMPSNKRKAARSIPQHCRGTAIRPSQDVIVPEDRGLNGTQNTFIRPQTSSSSGEEFFDASSIALLDGASDDHETRQVTGGRQDVKQQALPVKELATEKEQSNEDDHEDIEKEGAKMDGVVVNPVGRPGPRRRRRKNVTRNEHAQKTERETVVCAMERGNSEEAAQNATIHVSATAKEATDAAPLVSTDTPATSTPLQPPQAAADVTSSAQPFGRNFVYHGLSKVTTELIREYKTAVEKEKDPAKQDAIKQKFFADNDVEVKQTPAMTRYEAHQEQESQPLTVPDSQKTIPQTNMSPAEQASQPLLEVIQPASVQSKPTTTDPDPELTARRAASHARMRVLAKDRHFKKSAKRHYKAVDNEPDEMKRQRMRVAFMREWGLLHHQQTLPVQTGQTQQEEGVEDSEGMKGLSGSREESNPVQHGSSDVPPPLEPAAPSQAEQATQQPSKTIEDALLIASQPPARADRIPTPPTSHEQQDHVANENVEPDAYFDDGGGGDAIVAYEEEEYTHQGGRYVDPTIQISDWLNDPQSPAPPDEMPPSFGSPKPPKAKPEPAQRKPKQKRATKSGRKSKAKVDDSDDEYQDDGVQKDAENELDGDDARPVIMCDTSVQRGITKGAWTNEEKARADSILYAFCESYNWDVWTTKCRTGDWAGMNEDFKEALYGAFPSRSKKAIRGFCQRRWHIHKRGAWTKEEDEQLRFWYEKFRDEDGREGFWVEIGSNIDRAPQACRDRWKNVVQFEGRMNSGPWAVEEELDLTESVEACLDVLKEQAHGGDVGMGREELEKLLDWNKVSELMETMRSAKRCQEKWRALKRRAVVGEDSTLQRSTVTQIQQGQRQGQTLSKKLRIVEAAYNKLSWADVYHALSEISDAFTVEDFAQEFEHESTFWSLAAQRIGVSNLESKFKTNPKLRRRCYYGALEKFGDSGVENTAGFARRAGWLMDNMIKAKEKGGMEWVPKLVEKLMKDEGIVGVQVAAPGGVGEGGSRRVQPRRASTRVTHAGRGSQFLSTEHIEDSDDGYEADNNLPEIQQDIVEKVEVPETQETNIEADDAVAGAEVEDEDEEMELVDQVSMSSLNSRYDFDARMRSKTPKLAIRDFMQRCRATGGGARGVRR